VAVTPYATVDDLHAYLGVDPPADSQRLLARAQDLLDAETISSFFVTDANGNPTDPVVIAGLNKACCAQVEFWIASGDELDELGNWTSYAIAGVSVTRAAMTWQRRSRLCPRAKDALRQVITGVQFATAMLPGKPTI
jgi:hypothetical protein